MGNREAADPAIEIVILQDRPFFVTVETFLRSVDLSNARSRDAFPNPAATLDRMPLTLTFLRSAGDASRPS